MNKHIKNICLVIFYIAAVFIAGCLPEPDNSLDWSDDGSVGLLRVEGALYIVDGQTGELTEIAKEGVMPWPDISKDGSLIAYSREVDCNDLSEGLKMLPAGQVKMIEFHAKKLREEIIKNGGSEGVNLPSANEFPASWIIRYICENADADLLKLINEEEIQIGKEVDIKCYQIIVVPKDNLENKKIIISSAFEIIAVQLSPDNRMAAYLMKQDIEDEDSSTLDKDIPTFALYVASLESDIKAMCIADLVAYGYEWRKDSKAITYLKSDADEMSATNFGSLKESTIVDANGALLCELSEIPDHGLIRTHKYKYRDDTSSFSPTPSENKSLAGIIWYPWLKAEYGIDNRIFFTSPKMSFPMSRMENEEDWSLFCYDSLTGTITDVLPPDVKYYHEQGAAYIMGFALSPDGKKVLLPISENNSVIYEFGKNPIYIEAKEDDSSGEDVPEIFPAWKGNAHITHLASAESKFMPEEVKDKFTYGGEIVILKSNGQFDKILSEDWPLDKMFKIEEENGKTESQ